ncbi:acyl-CoA dehydrogenase family protein [Novosphingobium colocasiae]|nr:acyl-CoA dehydrogenase family protein [Novosphingobium colocasiae]
MDVSFTAEEEAFRREIRAFIAAEYPQSLRDALANGAEPTRENYLTWMRILAKKGWLAASWPKEYGGPGWSLTQQQIFRDELEDADTIRTASMGIAMCGPVIRQFGTAEQKARFLPPMVNAESWWCQGFSEPGAGSDLASIRTRAERVVGDDGKEYYRVNGQKTWTTLAQHADWGFFLVRTDPDAKKQKGISFLLIDMASPGIQVRPIETLGGDREVNEVWLEDVMVPIENRVHDENEGWTCAKFLLEHERSAIADVSRTKRRVKNLRALADERHDERGSVMSDAPAFRRKIAQLEIELIALEATNFRALTDASNGRDPGPLMSMLKTRGSEIAQSTFELTQEAAGPYGMVTPAPESGGIQPIGPRTGVRAADHYLNSRKLSIYGGSNEIQLTIIAKTALSL